MIKLLQILLELLFEKDVSKLVLLPMHLHLCIQSTLQFHIYVIYLSSLIRNNIKKLNIYIGTINAIIITLVSNIFLLIPL